jgi:hypothetical protein
VLGMRQMEEPNREVFFGKSSPVGVGCDEDRARAPNHGDISELLVDEIQRLSNRHLWHFECCRLVEIDVAREDELNSGAAARDRACLAKGRFVLNACPG